MKPYTYIIKHKPSGKVYYGVRSANKVDPEQDLWNKYFTSSPGVQKLIEETGADSFDIEIRKTFDTQEQAVAWETKVLRRMRVLESDRWINQNVAGYIIPTLESNAKISAYHKGKPKTEEYKRKIAEANKGISSTWNQTPEYRAKMSQLKINFISDIDSYESHFQNFINELISLLYTDVYETNQNHVMIDIGAEKGEITSILLNHIDKQSGGVISIDAHPDWLNKFSQVDNPLVEKYNTALYSKKCIKKFVASDQLTGTGFIGLPPDKSLLNLEKLKIFQLDCETLDNIITTDKKISFIKIDAESADFEIINGGKNTINKNRPVIVFEFSGQTFEKAHGRSREEFFQFFDNIQYTIYSVGLGKPKDQIAKLWDTFSLELKDIIAIPNEHLTALYKD